MAVKAALVTNSRELTACIAKLLGPVLEGAASRILDAASKCWSQMPWRCTRCASQPHLEIQMPPCTAMNINDPTAVKALLDQLRTSQAWQDTLISSATTSEDATAQSLPPTSVASLLSQLNTSQWSSSTINTPSVPTTRTAHESSQDIPRPSQGLPPTPSDRRSPRPVLATGLTHEQDIRSLPFQQALPYLTRLASDPSFLGAVSRLRQEQNELEQQLWEERQAIHKKHEEKVKVARTKATLIGTGISKHEADMMNDGYHKDLQRFDRERVLLAWDALIRKQQAALETLGVPTMFATASQADCQKQQRVIQVLEGLQT